MDIAAWKPEALLRASYLTAAFLVLVASAIPPLRRRFLDYGARASDGDPAQRSRRQSQHKSNDEPDTSSLSGLLDFIAGLNVPHGWFVSFYAVSVSCSLVWASIFLSNGLVLSVPTEVTRVNDRSMSMDQVVVAWTLMLVQGSRRLYECLTVSTASNSQMWIGHWVIGVLFYIATSISIWIEGTDTLRSHQMSIHDLKITGPSLRTFFAAIIFILASGFQHDVHAYLASLKNSGFSKGGRSVSVYQLPKHPAFNLCLTPHYFAECLIYLALTIQAAPSGSFINWTMACALVFVVINLGVTANGTRAWYKAKFGVDAVEGRSRMIPLVY